MQPCLFCGGDASEPDHLLKCDGRQGTREAAIADVPMLISGNVPATWHTSAAAALSIEESKDNQRVRVFDAIRASGLEGRTDDELQVELALDGSSERPRRWELWKLNLIHPLCDDTGAAIRRITRTNRRAVVWIAAAQGR